MFLLLKGGTLFFFLGGRIVSGVAHVFHEVFCLLVAWFAFTSGMGECVEKLQQILSYIFVYMRICIQHDIV